MKTRIIVLLSLFLFSAISCHERNNIYDIGNDNFVAPPHLDAWPAVLYYDPQGYLVGIGFQIEFTAQATRNFVIHHSFYQDISLRTNFETEVTRGSIGYTVDIFGPYEIGPYSLRFNFGGVAIGACIFEIVAENDVLVVKEASRYEETTFSSNNWVHVVKEWH